MSQQQISTNTFGVAKWVVSADPTQGTHTTIQAAINAASSGDTIFIRDGTYTQNITSKSGVSLSTLDVGISQGNVVIIGEITVTSGDFSVYGCTLQTNGSYFLSVSGSSSCAVSLDSCYFELTNNSGISFTNSSSSSSISINDCGGNISVSTGAIYSMSSPGILTIDSSDINNIANSVIPSSNSNGTVVLRYCNLEFPISTSATGAIFLYGTGVNTSTSGVTALTLAGNQSSWSFYSIFTAGTAPAVSIGSGCVLYAESIVVFSSNTNSLTGSGTLNYSSINFVSSTGVNVSTVNFSGFLPTSLSSLQITQQTFTSSGTYTPTAGMIYCIVEMVGGGGGGGGSPGGSVRGSGAGGGAGEYCRATFSAATIGASKSVTIGAAGSGGGATASGGNGGFTSLGVLMNAVGGNGGPAGPAGTSSGAGGTGGTGGSLPAGGISIQGNGGGYSISGAIATSSFSTSGIGGASFFGGAAPSVGSLNSSTAGVNATGYGSGGSGGTAADGNNLSGGNGSAGLILITEYVV